MILSEKSATFRDHALGARLSRSQRRRSSVVERVIGNDEVLSSILSGGTMSFAAYPEEQSGQRLAWLLAFFSFFIPGFALAQSTRAISLICDFTL